MDLNDHHELIERLQDLLEWMKVRVDAELEKEAPPVFCPEMIN